MELLEVLNPRKGHFRLESGYHGALWLALDPLFTIPARIQPFIETLAHRLHRHNIDAVCGPLVGGAFLAQAIASLLDIDFYYTERYVSPTSKGLYPIEYSLPASVADLVRGKAVAIVDD